jgi:ABC-type nitrate/sulfonate/bicarbonate transport system permease component
MIVAASLPPVAISVLGGAKRVDATYIRAARMMGVHGFALLVRVLLPGALPHVVSGLRVGMGNAWRVMVAAEMIVGTGTGLGYSIIQARWTLDYPAAFACVLLICIIGLVFERVVFVNLERWTVERWGLPMNI